MKVGDATQGAQQTLRAIRTAVAFATYERDYLVGGLEGLGTQQVTNVIAEALKLLLEGLDYVEGQLHQRLQLPLQDGHCALSLAYDATLTGTADVVASSVEIACANFSYAHSQYEDHAFLRIFCSCAVGILWSLQGARDRMSHHFREALCELEAFRFLKISAAMGRLATTDGSEEFIQADLERHVAEKIDALPIPEWGITLAELHATLQATREVPVPSDGGRADAQAIELIFI
ncbi:MAG: hypothetical protein AAFY11_03480 [Cyanobacteria bacterium J06641_5]